MFLELFERWILALKMYANTSINMGVRAKNRMKTLTMRDEVYRKPVAMKANDESFS
jgi:hypothetical protein